MQQCIVTASVSVSDQIYDYNEFFEEYEVQGITIKMGYVPELKKNEKPFELFTKNGQKESVQYVRFIDKSEIEVKINQGNIFYFNEEDSQWENIEEIVNNQYKNLPFIQIIVQDQKIGQIYMGRLSMNEQNKQAPQSFLSTYDCYQKFKKEVPKLFQPDSLIKLEKNNEKSIFLSYHENIQALGDKIIEIKTLLQLKDITLDEQLKIINKYLFQKISILTKEIQEIKQQKQKIKDFQLNLNQLTNIYDQVYSTQVFSESMSFNFKLIEEDDSFQIGLLSNGDIENLQTNRAIFFEIPTGKLTRGDNQEDEKIITLHKFQSNDEIRFQVNPVTKIINIDVNEMRIASIKFIKAIVTYSFIIVCNNNTLDQIIDKIIS